MLLSRRVVSRSQRGGSECEFSLEGSFFGELALLNEEPRSATVTCLSDVSCLVIHEQHFKSSPLR